MMRAICFQSAYRVTLIAIGWTVLFVTPAALLFSSESRSSVYSISTVIVYNTAVPESKEVALAYAAARGIADSQVIALTCPDRESITREEYQELIEDPLRSAFIGNGWFEVSRNALGAAQVTSNRIHVLALMYGMPLRIENSLRFPEPLPGSATGEPVPPVPVTERTNAASVDSELCLLALSQADSKGAAGNPYFESDSSFYRSRHPALMLVGRIDGPSATIAKRLITDALRVEEAGLWGYAYIDQSQKYQLGDDWLRRSAETLASEGIPVVLDRHPARFPLNYPMEYAALYFGWYSENVDGPFLDPNFRFLPGAVACHLHSFSAQTLRSESAHWAGPLLSRGACAVLGNVSEPYLTATHHFDLFTDRLLKGYTLVESAYMAIPTLSWMGIVVGDPLYRPYESWSRFDQEVYSRGADADLKALRLATKRWALDDPAQYHRELAAAAAKLDSGRILEAMALAASNRGDFEDSALWFQEALETFSSFRDQFRVQLHRVELARRLGRNDEAVGILQQLAGLEGSHSSAEAAKEILDQLRPPPPPLPPPPEPALPKAQ